MHSWHVHALHPLTLTPPPGLQGEARTVAAFKADPYGCSEELAGKRAKRDPFSHGGLTPDRCPAMGGLLEHCGPGPFDGILPWGEGGDEGLWEEEEGTHT